MGRSQTRSSESPCKGSAAQSDIAPHSDLAAIDAARDHLSREVGIA